MSTAGRRIKMLAAAVAAVAVMAGGAFAQGAATRYLDVPFKVNANATVTAVQSEDTVKIEVKANVQKDLRLPLEVNAPPSVSVQRTGMAQGKLNAPAVSGSRGNITLRLPAQSYSSAEIALYSVNGKRVMRAKAAASEAVNGVSRRNLAAGIYILSAKGVNGGAFTSRLTHGGGKMNINVAFGAENASPSAARPLGKKAADGDWDWVWEITISEIFTGTQGYEDSTYNLDIENLALAGLDVVPTQNVTLKIKPGTPTPAKTTFTDARDDKPYQKVTIGTQTWMAENLNYRGKDGSVIGACYDNKADSCAKYGRLYTFSEAGTACPAGWHLPSDAEFTTLTNYIGGLERAGGKLKSAGGWESNGNGTDDYGFSALPGSGGFNGSTGSYEGSGVNGFWWSGSRSILKIVAASNAAERETRDASNLLSVRCVRDTEYKITFNANGGTVSPEFGTTAGVTARLASLPTPTRDGGKFIGWFTSNTGGTAVTAGAAGTVFTANATIYAYWVVTGTFTDARDDKTYNKVTIGTQTWMAENLNYRNSSGSNDTVGVCYNSSADSCAKYGRLYNWSTAMGGASSSSANPSRVQGVCPVDWHLPSDAEWTQLTNLVGTNAGTKLKSSTGWNSNGNGTDDFGFSALPGGHGYGGSFGNAGNSGLWWSATQYNADYAWRRYMYFNNSSVDRLDNLKSNLYSVRCVENPVYIITFNANGGTVTPTFGTTGTNGRLASLPTPTRDGYAFKGWYTTSTGSTTVTTSRVYTANTTIYAQWIVVGTFTDGRDDKTYNKVTIGAQTWMAENLNYRGEEGSEIGKCYGNSADSCAKYGRLYNWSTAMGGASSSSANPSGVQGACPVGWHLPSDAEWTALTNFVGSSAGKKLKSTSGWYNNGNGTGDYGFAALPGGGGASDGFFGDAGSIGYWWSATEGDASSAWYRDMNYDEGVNRLNDDKSYLWSVRCVADK